MSMAVFILGAILAAAEKPAFERYQPIIERSPFGKADMAGISVVASNFMTRFAFVGLIGTADNGFQAVILDKQTQQCHFKSPGETLGDITIVRVEDVQPKRRLVLRQGLETGALIFGEGGAVPVATAPPPAAKPAIPMPGMPAAPTSTEPPTTRRRVPFIR